MKRANEQTFNFEADRWTSAASTRKTIIRLKSYYLLPGGIEKLRRERRNFGVRRPVGALVAGDLSQAASRQVATDELLECADETFGVRRPVGALVAGDLSPAASRQVATHESGDRSPHSKSLNIKLHSALQTTRLTVLKDVR